MNFLKNLRSNIPLAVEALLIAIFVWFVISITQYPSVRKTIEHVPLSTDITGSAPSSNGLSLISCDVGEVTVDLLGSRTEVGNLNNDNLIAYLDMDNVTSSGTKKLTVKIKSESGINYEVKSIEPDSATVVFDKYDTREYPVTPIIPNVEFAKDKAINPDEFTCEPNVVRITGPSAQLDKISKCLAISTKKLTLDSSYVITNDELQLQTDEGAVIDQSQLKFNTTNFNISIPVRTQKTVKLTVSIVNAPSDFDQNSLSFSMSSNSVVLAANNSQTDIPDTLEIGKIPLNSLDIGYTNTFSLSSVLESSEYINVSNIETVTVSLDSENLEKNYLTLDQNRITLSNIPDNSYIYTILTERLPVSIVGPADIIYEVTADDIIADVNLLNTNINTNQFTSNVTFSCPKYSNVWVVTNSKVSVQRQKEEPESYSNDGSETV